MLRTGEPLLASSEQYEELRKKGEIEIIGERAVDWLGVPLKSQERTIGVLAVQLQEGQITSENRSLVDKRLLANTRMQCPRTTGEY